LCGYQGWFRCPGDPAGGGFGHWSRNGREITPDSITFEMWPDMSEYGEDEKYAAPGFTYPDGKAAALFRSANAKTVKRHFEWMESRARKMIDISATTASRFCSSGAFTAIDSMRRWPIASSIFSRTMRNMA